MWKHPCSTTSCSYSTTENSNKQVGILRQKPNHQAHSATTALFQDSHQGSSQYARTDVQAAMHTFYISPPKDQWYMDTGATSHMTVNRGNLFLLQMINMSNNITIGSGHNILVIGYGHASLPISPYSFNLHNVLHALN